MRGKYPYRDLREKVKVRTKKPNIFFIFFTSFL